MFDIEYILREFIPFVFIALIVPVAVIILSLYITLKKNKNAIGNKGTEKIFEEF